MSYDITESRTPPTLMLSATPTSEREFNYPQNPPIILSAERFKDVSNLKVNQRRSRSFTPVKNSLYLRSPELSPIGVTGNRQQTPETNVTCKESSFCDTFTPVQFKLPQPLMKSNTNTTPTGPPDVNNHHHYYHHHKHSHQVENTLGTPIEAYLDPNQSHSLDKSASHGYLNHKLDVRLVLKNASMQQYIGAFNKGKVDFEKFLTLCEDDLLRLGVKKKGDRQVLSRIISDLNST